MLSPPHSVRTIRSGTFTPADVSVFGYALAFLVFLLGTLPEYSVLNRLLAWGIFVVGTRPALAAYFDHRARVPILELVLLNYVVFYALPVFFQDNLLVYSGEIVIDNLLVTETLAYTLMAVVSIQAGAAVLQNRLDKPPVFTLNTNPQALSFLGFGLIAADLFVASGGLPVPAVLARPVQAIFSLDLGLALLAFSFFRGALGRLGKIAALAALALACLIGLSTGMTQATVQPLLIWGIAAGLVRGRLPLGLMVTVVLLFFVLQPIKQTFRSEAWFGSYDTSSRSEKVVLFGTLAYDYWTGVADDENADVGEDVQDSASERLTLLLLTTRLVDWTPEQFAFTNGESLSYMLYSWVPRALWPGKPPATLANQVYPVRYGLQHPNTLSTTSIGVGHIGEVYINVGTALLPFIFFLVGMAYMVPYLLVGKWTVDDGATAILIAAAVESMFVGSTVSSALGVLAQQVFVQVLIVKAFATQRASKRIS